MRTSLQNMLDTVIASDDCGTDICPSWLQGRAAFGGLATSVALTALQKEDLEGKSLRSLMTNFVAPLPAGATQVNTAVLRSGRSVTQSVADVVANGQITTHVSATFGAPRPSLAVAPVAAFNPDARESVAPLDSHDRRRPPFMSHFDIHWTGGGIPMANTKSTSLSMWVRHKDDISRHPEAKLVALADIPPAIIFSHYDRMIMISSLSWSLDFVRPAEDVSSDWFYLEFEMHAAADGYSQQSGKIFDAQGNLCLLTRQSMVYFE
ncbi:thioesterase family protein [Kordiimonas pumila]|uniref:Thioesterase family protein n=1 Tax=Kordiimonas pumila TaxID=2161677 RepID=A0ABV7D961_9PROT|nr:thioesterase family protein [Kordiimonas pumila]